MRLGAKRQRKMLRGRASQLAPEIVMRKPEMRAKGIAWCAVLQEGLIFTFIFFFSNFSL